MSLALRCIIFALSAVPRNLKHPYPLFLWFEFSVCWMSSVRPAATVNATTGLAGHGTTLLLSCCVLVRSVSPWDGSLSLPLSLQACSQTIGRSMEAILQVWRSSYFRSRYPPRVAGALQRWREYVWMHLYCTEKPSLVTAWKYLKKD